MLPELQGLVVKHLTVPPLRRLRGASSDWRRDVDDEMGRHTARLCQELGLRIPGHWPRTLVLLEMMRIVSAHGVISGAAALFVERLRAGEKPEWWPADIQCFVESREAMARMYEEITGYTECPRCDVMAAAIETGMEDAPIARVDFQCAGIVVRITAQNGSREGADPSYAAYLDAPVCRCAPGHACAVCLLHLRVGAPGGWKCVWKPGYPHLCQDFDAMCACLRGPQLVVERLYGASSGVATFRAAHSLLRMHGDTMLVMRSGKLVNEDLERTMENLRVVGYTDFEIGHDIVVHANGLDVVGRVADGPDGVEFRVD